MVTQSSSIKAAAMACLLKGLFVIAAMAHAMAAEAAELSTDPGDYVALPPGTDLGLLYYQHAERDRVKVDGNTVTKNFELDSDIGIARFIHWTQLGNFTVTPQIILPFGNLDLSGGQSRTAAGVGDPVVGSAIWLINDPVNERYLAVAGFVGIPVGTYDADKANLNLGENRWKAISHLAYVQPIIPKKLYGEVTLEKDTFGKNDDYAGATLREDDVFEVQTHLRYALNHTNQLAVSYYHTVGGENHINGLAQNDAPDTDRFLLTWQHFFNPGLQLQSQIGQDLDVRNGPEEKLRLNFRLAHAF